jgi:type I restriction enzyme, S subunit
MGRTARMLTVAGLRSGSALVPERSLIVSTRAPIGYVTEVSQPTAFNQGCRGLTPISPIDTRYFRYQLLTLAGALQGTGQGSTFLELSSEALASMRVRTPTPEAQRAIANYLDAETARIDALIAKKRRMIDLLDQRFWHSFIDRVRASGDRVAQLRRAFTFLTDGPFGNVFTSSDYSSGGAAVVRLGNIGFAEYRPADQAFIPMELYGKLLRHRVRPDDLLIAGLGDDRNHAGRACVAPSLGPAMVKGKCFCARVRRDLGVPEYLALLLSSPLGAAAMGLSSRGSTRSMINLDVVKAALVPLPPAVDQERIVRESLTERAKIQRLTAALRGQLELLSEHRQALITEAVTGQSEVTQVAA